MVRVRCSHCPQVYQVPKEKLGTQATCKKCQHTFTLEIATDETGIQRAKPLSVSSVSHGIVAMPRKLGQYLLKKKLGAGAMGEVWLAHDPALERDAAIKLMAPGIASDPERRQRFEREAKTAARLLHTNTVAVYSFGIEGEHAYLAMELVEGSSLDKVVSAGGPLPWREATRAICDAARGLAAAHDLGLVHRDVKPANLMRTGKGVTKVVDFGLARAVLSDTHLTQDGSLLGTPAFMAPEQWVAGKEVDARSDLYSLICTYYFLLTARLPFNAASLPALGYQHRYEPFPDPRQAVPELPEAVCRILARGSQKEPVQRYQTGSELVSELEALLREGDAPADSSRSAAAPALPAPNVAPPRGRGNRLARIAAAAGSLAILLGIISYVATREGSVTVDRPGNRTEVELKVGGDTVNTAPLGARLQVDPTIPVEFQQLKAQNPAGTYALQFDGQKSRVRIAKNKFKFFGDTPLTIEAFVTPEASFLHRAVMSDLASGAGFNLILRPASPLSGYLSEHWYFGYASGEPANNGWVGVGHAAKVIPGKRVHLAAVFDRKALELRLFVDGKLNGAVAQATHRYRDTDWDTIIGADPNHPKPSTFEHFFKGKIEQLSVAKIARYEKDFEPDEVLRGDEHTALLYHFNEGEGRIAYDSSGKGNHADIEFAQWVRLTPDDSASAATFPADPLFKPLFNGRDLTGWKSHPDQPGGWTVEDGNLVGRSVAKHHLFSERGDFDHFHLRAELKINDGGNSGIYFRSKYGLDRGGWKTGARSFPDAYEVQVLHRDPVAPLTGCLQMHGAPSLNPPYQKSSLRPDRWFTLEILALGNHFTIMVNGKTTVDAIDPDNHYRQGHLVLQALSDEFGDNDTVVHFRKIEVKDLISPHGSNRNSKSQTDFRSGSRKLEFAFSAKVAP